ncbi:MAG: ABC transporter permease [Clostridiales bacterium]|nr:ABC transporter permease [Clostridiales bacterium]
MKRNNNLIFGLILTGGMMLLFLIGFFYTPYDPNAMDGSSKFMAPGFLHIMGTDNFGRDIFSRILEGLRTTFVVALSVTGIGTIFGIMIGAITGYFGGWIDEVLMRINDAMTAFPSILLALVFISILGPGKYNVIIALGIIFIPSYARIVRGEFMQIKTLDFVKSGKLMGAGNLRIMFLHILPNLRISLLSAITIGFNNAVLAEAGMSYLGIGVQPPDASLGRMLSEAQGYLFSAPWYAICPGIVIILLILGFSLINEGLGEHND